MVFFKIYLYRQAPLSTAQYMVSTGHFGCQGELQQVALAPSTSPPPPKLHMLCCNEQMANQHFVELPQQTVQCLHPIYQPATSTQHPRHLTPIQPKLPELQHQLQQPWRMTTNYSMGPHQPFQEVVRVVGGVYEKPVEVYRTYGATTNNIPVASVAPMVTSQSLMLSS